MPKQTKTNAVRLLEKAGIAYSTHEYHFDENDLAATHVAEELPRRPPTPPATRRPTS